MSFKKDIKDNNPQGVKFEFLDVAKAIAIILMVAGHCAYGKFYGFNLFFNLFHMATFIFISGYLFKNRYFKTFSKYKEYLFIKIKKLYLFYFKYECLFYIFKNLFFKIGWYNSSIIYGGKIIKPITTFSMFFKGLLKIIFGLGTEPFCGAFWYIISLIFIIIMYSTIVYISQKQKKIDSKLFVRISVTICFLIGYLMQKFINIPRIAPAFTLILIYHLGNEVYTYGKIKFNNYKLCLLCFIGLLILSKFGYISINHNEYINPFYFIGCSILGIYFLLSLSNFLLEKIPFISKKLSFIGMNTLKIMAWHYIGFKIAMLIQFKVLNIDYSKIAILGGYKNDNLWWLVYIICGIMLPLIIVKIENFGKLKLKKGVRLPANATIDCILARDTERKIKRKNN